MHPLRHWLNETDWLTGVFSPCKNVHLEWTCKFKCPWKCKRSLTAVNVAFTFSCNIDI